MSCLTIIKSLYLFQHLYIDYRFSISDFSMHRCEKCKKVFEHVKRIAVMFDEIDDLVIAKYDYVANELPLHSIEKMITHFPSFLYVKSAGQSSTPAIDYNLK